MYHSFASPLPRHRPTHVLLTFASLFPFGVVGYRRVAAVWVCVLHGVVLTRAEVVQGKGQGEGGQPGPLQRGHLHPLPG